jgi:protein subunit release factor B
MSIFPVSEAKEKALRERMASLGIREEDIEESFVRSGGPGGQNVNKTATQVQLRHLPSGLEVRCSRARTQGLNRYHARVLLADKLETQIRGRESEERKRIEKIRRQKRKRSKRAKEKMLADKRKISEKKRLRAQPKVENDHY